MKLQFICTLHNSFSFRIIINLKKSYLKTTVHFLIELEVFYQGNFFFLAINDSSLYQMNVYLFIYFYYCFEEISMRSGTIACSIIFYYKTVVW